jgi:hypothetical protein
MYPRPHALTEAEMALRAASYVELEASLEVKWMSSRVRLLVLAALSRKFRMARPASFSLWYIWAESILGASLRQLSCNQVPL